VRWSNILSRHSLTLSEHLIASDCGDLSSVPINSVCQISAWSEPIEHSSTHWQHWWLKTIWLELPLLQLLGSKSEKEMWDVITRRTMLWHKNNQSSYHCPRNWTGWEQTSIPSVEHPVWASIEPSSCTGDHGPNFIVQLPWYWKLDEIYTQFKCAPWKEKKYKHLCRSSYQSQVGDL